jgi:hypothetical protein
MHYTVNGLIGRSVGRYALGFCAFAEDLAFERGLPETPLR